MCELGARPRVGLCGSAYQKCGTTTLFRATHPIEARRSPVPRAASVRGGALSGCAQREKTVAEAQGGALAGQGRRTCWSLPAEVTAYEVCCCRFDALGFHRRVCDPTVAITERLARRPARPAVYVEERVREGGPPLERDVGRLSLIGKPPKHRPAHRRSDARAAILRCRTVVRSTLEPGLARAPVRDPGVRRSRLGPTLSGTAAR